MRHTCKVPANVSQKAGVGRQTVSLGLFSNFTFPHFIVIRMARRAKLRYVTPHLRVSFVGQTNLTTQRTCGSPHTIVSQQAGIGRQTVILGEPGLLDEPETMSVWAISVSQAKR